MYLVNPNEGDKYYLRLMLTQIRGAKNFDDLKTVNGVVYPSYKSAAEAMGLLESDEEWDKLLEEAAGYNTPKQLRLLFVNILLHCQPTDPRKL